MEPYRAIAVNPRTDEIEYCSFMPEFFGRDGHGVRFNDGTIWPKNTIRNLQRVNKKGARVGVIEVNTALRQPIGINPQDKICWEAKNGFIYATINNVTVSIYGPVRCHYPNTKTWYIVMMYAITALKTKLEIAIQHSWSEDFIS